MYYNFCKNIFEYIYNEIDKINNIRHEILFSVTPDIGEIFKNTNTPRYLILV